MKSISGLTRNFNACKSHLYLKSQHKPLQHESHNKKDVLSRNWEDENDLLGKTVTTATANDISETPTEDGPWKKLFASKFLLTFKEKWFSSHKFPTGILISDKKFTHSGSKYKNSFYPFNNQIDYGLAHYFVELETTKGNMNKFLIDALMAPLTKMLLYKNTDEWVKKLLEIPWTFQITTGLNIGLMLKVVFLRLQD